MTRGRYARLADSSSSFRCLLPVGWLPASQSVRQRTVSPRRPRPIHPRRRCDRRRLDQFLLPLGARRGVPRGLDKAAFRCPWERAATEQQRSEYGDNGRIESTKRPCPDGATVKRFRAVLVLRGDRCRGHPDVALRPVRATRGRVGDWGGAPNRPADGRRSGMIAYGHISDNPGLARLPRSGGRGIPCAALARSRKRCSTGCSVARPRACASFPARPGEGGAFSDAASSAGV